MDVCPQCRQQYEACDCPATKGAAAEPITPELIKRAHAKAAITLILSGAKPQIPTDRSQFKEREFTTGNLGRLAQNQDSYTVGWTAQELQTYRDKQKKQKRLIAAEYQKERDRKARRG